MTTALSGSFMFGEVASAASDVPTGHAIRTRSAFNTDAYATKLSTSHLLGVRGDIITQAVCLGYGPGAIHPLRTTSLFVVQISPASVRFSHALRASSRFELLVDPVPLRFSHTLATRLSLDTQAGATALALAHQLRTRLAFSTQASAAQLRLGHAMQVTGHFATEASARDVATLPTLPLDPTATTITNLIINPTAATSLEGWAVENGALLLGVDTDHAWFGEHSVAGQFHNPAVHERLTVATPAGLGLATYPGAILWGQILLAVGEATSLTARVWTRAQYRDQTIANGIAIDAVVTADGVDAETWDTVYAPYLILATDLELEQAWVIVEPLGADAFPCALFVGAAQIEYDPLMRGASVVIGLVVPEANVEAA